MANEPPCIPLLTLKAAAGAFGDEQSTEALESDAWVVPTTSHKLRKGMFVAQVVGRSMEPLIPDGSYCLFAHPLQGSRSGLVVLAHHRAIQDPESGGQFTVKRYRSEKEHDGTGGWRHAEIRLEPVNPEYEPIVLRHGDWNYVIRPRPRC